MLRRSSLVLYDYLQKTTIKDFKLAKGDVQTIQPTRDGLYA